MLKASLPIGSTFFKCNLNNICFKNVEIVAFQAVHRVNNYCTAKENSGLSSNNDQHGNVNRPQLKEKVKVINAPKFISRTSSLKLETSTLRCKSKKGNITMESLKKTDDKIIWVDCEMTGLDIDKDQVMEIAVIITDGNLQEIARHPSIVINVAEDILNNMNEWCTKHHGESGLTYSCKNSSVTHAMGDEMLLNFVQKHTYPGVSPLAGNSNYMDRLFLSKQMPKFHKHLHYRTIDVSTIKELVMRWYPEEYSKAPRKNFAHRVMSDIEESIAELEYYRSAVFRKDKVEKTVDKNASVSMERLDF